VAGDPDHPRRTVLRYPGETGLLIVGEVDFDLGGSRELQFGAWHYTSRFERIEDPAQTGRSSGAYAMAEGVLLNHGEAELGAWIRGGVASDRVNPIGLYLGGGATYGTENQTVGLAIAHARLGDPAVRAGRAAGQAPLRAETAIELSYAHRLHDHIMLQPDIQYVINPGWDRTVDNALVGGVRLHLTLF
jgi:porin